MICCVNIVCLCERRVIFQHLEGQVRGQDGNGDSLI